MSLENSSLASVIENIRNNYPKFLSTKDLIKLNIFPSCFAVYNASKKLATSPSIKIGKQKLLYSKESFLFWIQEKEIKNKQEKQNVESTT